MLAPKGLSITSSDAAQRARTIDVMRRLCDLAADLGARILVHGSPAQRTLEPGREADGRKWGAECFAAVAEAAAKAGVTYCIEPLAAPDNQFVHTVEEAAAIVRAVASPALRTMVDCAAAARAETQAIPDLLRQWLPTGLIAHIHLNDPNRRGPGEGDLAFAPILQALQAGGYRRHGRHRALHLRARRPRLRRPRHRLRARACCPPSPRLRGEGRGEGQRQLQGRSKILPLTLTLSPRKSGERGHVRRARLTPGQACP